MNVVRITPRGYCHGVVDAVRIAKRVAEEHHDDNVPIYMLGYLVHNEHVTAELETYGVQLIDAASRLNGLDAITEGIVIFTAHGVSPAVIEKARLKGLTIIDATCSDVTRTHDLIDRLSSEGYTVIYIGKRGHPEPEGSIGHAVGPAYLVEDRADIEALDIDPAARIAVTCQTTLSVWDTTELIGLLEKRFPNIEVFNEICLATQQRQEAAVAAAAAVESVVVVGSPRSSNSRRLVQVVEERAHTPAHLVDTVADIRPEWFLGMSTVGVTSGASTPTHLTREVITFLEELEPPR